jgi:hypothetical protein
MNLKIRVVAIYNVGNSKNNRANGRDTESLSASVLIRFF